MRLFNDKARSLGLAFVLALVAAALTAIPAGAVPPSIGVGGTESETSATVSNGSAGTPNIECAWLLPDNDTGTAGSQGDDGFSRVSASTPRTTGMDYGPDDKPKTPDPGDECHADPELAPGVYGPALQNNPTTSSAIQVMPNAHDRCAFQASPNPAYDAPDPTHANDCLQWIELWVAVDEASPGNTLVIGDVYHPDGTLKVNIVLERLEGIGTQGQHGQRCDFPAGMEEAATVGTGQVTTAAFDNMKWECREQNKSFFYGAFDLSKHQPWGKYRVLISAETIGGGIANHEISFYVMPFTQLEKDFLNVSFGQIAAGSALQPAHGFSQPGGDFTWDGVNTPGAKSTIRNVGNAGAMVGIWFDPLCYTGTGQPTLLNCYDSVKRIDRFDAKFGAYQGSSAASTLIAYGYESAATAIPAWDDGANEHPDAKYLLIFDDGDKFESVLCPNQVGKIEFSLWTEGIRQGTYVGVQADGTLGGIHLESFTAWDSPWGSPCNTDAGKADVPHLTGEATTYPYHRDF